MKEQIIFTALFIFLFSCNQRSKSTKDKNFSHSKNDSLNMKKKSSKNNLLTSLLTGRDTMNFKLKISSPEQHIKVPVDITSADSLFASLSSSDKKANIRINQIQLPDSTFDGPFGRNLHYKISQYGIFNIIIGEDMMAGDRWTGKFILKVWVK